jgi:hypothetical protein
MQLCDVVKLIQMLWKVPHLAELPGYYILCWGQLLRWGQIIKRCSISGDGKEINALIFECQHLQIILLLKLYSTFWLASMRGVACLFCLEHLESFFACMV